MHYRIKSQALRYKDFSSAWYKKWSILLKQEDGLYGLRTHNKAWQNAAILQALSERGYLKEGNRAIGFGVGTERIPSALAALGISVTATDQDLESGLKAGWDNLGQLTHDRQDLNLYSIAPLRAFNKNVSFQNCDMTRISKDFDNCFDIAWSNCALGHLGSLDAGLAFIENSLRTLKPGGIAIHTTEINVTSDTQTLDSGGTVIFRQGDMIQLFNRLRKQGYKCAPLYLDFGNQPEDMVFSGFPYEDDPLLKLNVGRHLLSQMILIITKPKKLRPSLTADLAMKAEIRLNSHLRASYLQRNTALQTYLSVDYNDGNTTISPLVRSTKIQLQPGEVTTVRLAFRNTSSHHLYDTFQVFHSGNPLVVATGKPVNRTSKLATKTWASRTRPPLALSSAKLLPLLKGIAPGAKFWATIPLKAPAKSGVYREDFCFVLEGLGPILKSDFSIAISVKTQSKQRRIQSNRT